MIIRGEVTPFDNQLACGERLIPADDESAHATYLRHGRVCGITYDTSTTSPHLRFSPGYQLPPCARDKRSFKRFVWECEDERAVNLTLDERDGELTLFCNDRDLDDTIEDTIEEYLEFLLGDAFHDELVAYVRSCIE
jgi:hypothetical protein